MNTVVGLAKAVGFAVKPTPLSSDQAATFSSFVGIMAAASFVGGYYLTPKILKRNFAIGVVVLVGIGFVGLLSYAAQAGTKSQAIGSSQAATIAPSFTELDSNLVDTDGFSIAFPSNPRRAVVNQKAGDENLRIETYQAGDGVGMYAVSYGQLDAALRGVSQKKEFVRNLFKGLVSTAKNAQVHTEHQSDQMPFDLSYLYTSDFHGDTLAHMGMVFLVDDKAYIKITLVYPESRVDEATEKYTQFLNTLQLKKK